MPFTLESKCWLAQVETLQRPHQASQAWKTSTSLGHLETSTTYACHEELESEVCQLQLRRSFVTAATGMPCMTPMTRANGIVIWHNHMSTTDRAKDLGPKQAAFPRKKSEGRSTTLTCACSRQGHSANEFSEGQKQDLGRKV